ncbi:MAG: hypothetical protein Q8N54_01115 [Sulfurimicrobium sp.]|nr:hypothetical protein [Sulfurimicrobium sp.]MDZ7656286.1 hypothetical protein [Sulfurimicrobium sp.]
MLKSMPETTPAAMADHERLTRYRDAIDEAHTAWRAFNAIRDLVIPTAPKTAYSCEPHMDEINREDFCALMEIVNNKLGNALEIASGRGAQ